MDQYVNRKSFLAGLGAAGFGLAAGVTGSARNAMAQDDSTDASMPDASFESGLMEKRLELYNAFTAALATELDIDSSDEVDGAIRIAIMNVIDDQVGEDGLTAGQAEALKVLVATSDVPMGPMMFGHGSGGGGRFGQGMGSGSMGRGRFQLRDRMGDKAGRGDHSRGRSRSSSKTEADACMPSGAEAKADIAAEIETEAGLPTEAEANADMAEEIEAEADMTSEPETEAEP